MTPRIYTAAEARALREAAPAGPYEACHPDDLPGRSLVSGGREVRPPYDAFCVGLEDRVRVALAELFAASPDLAATVEAQSAEIARLRALLPAVAVVVCPACGVDITADLDDDAEYITRRHSRRTTAIGLGEIVWCDGGIARAVSR